MTLHECTNTQYHTHTHARRLTRTDTRTHTHARRLTRTDTRTHTEREKELCMQAASSKSTITQVSAALAGAYQVLFCLLYIAKGETCWGVRFQAIIGLGP